MTDDIVTMLRNWHTEWDWYLPDQAADEIKRLRADRDRWRKIADGLSQGRCLLTDESEDCAHEVRGERCPYSTAYDAHEQAVRGD